MLLIFARAARHTEKLHLYVWEKLSLTHFRRVFDFVLTAQMCIQNPVKHLRWCFLWGQLTVFSRSLFLEVAPP